MCNKNVITHIKNSFFRYVFDYFACVTISADCLFICTYILTFEINLLRFSLEQSKTEVKSQILQGLKVHLNRCPELGLK